MNIKKAVLKILCCDMAFIILNLVYLIAPIYLGYDFIGIVYGIAILLSIYWFIKQFVRHETPAYSCTIPTVFFTIFIFLFEIASILFMSYLFILWVMFKP